MRRLRLTNAGQPDHGHVAGDRVGTVARHLRLRGRDRRRRQRPRRGQGPDPGRRPVRRRRSPPRSASTTPRSAAGNISRLEDAARKVADGNFETPIPVASAGQLGQLARTFNEMQRRLAELDSARKQFIANASHELRTPIFSLGGFVELLEEEDPSPEERAEFVRTMREQIERLTKLTADLLDLSQLDAGRDGDAERAASTSAPSPARWPASSAPRADLHGSRLELRTPEPAGDRQRRPRPGAPDHPYPARQRPHPHPRGHQGDRDHLLRQPPRRADRLRRGAGHPPARPEPDLRALLHGRHGRRLGARAGDRPRARPADGRPRSRSASSQRFTAFTLDLPPAQASTAQPPRRARSPRRQA